MRKIILIATVVALSVFLNACQEETAESKLFGTWKIENISSSAEMNDIEKEMFDQNNQDVIKNTKYDFKENGLVKFSYGEKKSDWTWKYKPKRAKLELKTNDGQVYNYHVQKLEESKMVWVDTIDEYNIQTTIYKKVE